MASFWKQRLKKNLTSGAHTSLNGGREAVGFFCPYTVHIYIHVYGLIVGIGT